MEKHEELSMLEQVEEDHSIVPIFKRNLTPDDYLTKNPVNSYVLVDQKN